MFGKGNDFAARVDLGSLDGTNGFVLQGIDSKDYSGHSVSTAGDFNGDGNADILIGAYNAESETDSAVGETYVVFGASTSFSSNM